MEVLDLGEIKVVTVAVRYTYFSFVMLHHRLWYVGTNISEGPDTSIFTVE